MGRAHLKMLQLLLLVTIVEICAAQNGITLTVYTVTSKSMTMHWTPYTGASSYQITVTPKNSPGSPQFVQFGQHTVMGSIISLTPNTVYTVKLEAMDAQNAVIASTGIEAATAPDIPTIIQTYSKSSESITVEFTDVAGATGYIVRAESKAHDFFSETHVSSSPGTVVGLQPYSDYEVSIMSVNSWRRSQPSYPVDQKTVIVAPNLITTSPNSSTIIVTWDPVKGAVLYVFVIIREGSNVRVDKNTTDTMLVLNGLEPGTNYTIKAFAVDDKGRPGDDQTFSQITRPGSPSVFDVQLNQQGRAVAMVYWGQVQGAESYTVWITNNQTCNATLVSFCYIAPVECGQNHTLSVTAYNGAGPSEPSNPAQYLTYPCPPNNTQVEEHEPGNCSVVWDKVEMVDFYMVYVKGNNGNEKMCNTTETICMFDCTCGHTFISIVVPYNKVGGSPIVHLVNYTTIPCCPEHINITLVSSETVEIIWPEVSGAELYEVTAAETSDIIHCNDTEPICALSDLDCDTTYSITVTPCSEISGCNETCKAHTQVTAPCAPEIINVTQVVNSTYRVHFSTLNRVGTQYTITATTTGPFALHTCTSTEGSCDLTNMPCGTIFEVLGVAYSNNGGKSLPGFEKILETGPCCPEKVVVTQETQAMSNVSWSPARGASSFLTSLTSHKGDAKCHTVDTHCLMGCITCGTNYSISMEAISSTGHKSECNYQGFSSSPCCPTNIKLIRFPEQSLSLRVYWRSLGPQIYKHSVELSGRWANLTCEAAPGVRYCDMMEGTCGEVYTVLVTPVHPDGTKVDFCQKRTYSVPCPGNVNMLMSGVNE